MKNILICFFIISAQIVKSQEFKQDNRSSETRVNTSLFSKADNITNEDIVQALNISGIGIHKFELGEFKKKRKLLIMLEKYHNGNLEKTDTIMNASNTYLYSDDTGTVYYDYLKEIKVFTRDLDEGSLVRIYSSIRDEINIALPKSNDITYFEWREYKNTDWKLDQRIPLLMYASSWWDEDFDVERFCGVRYLENDSEGEEEFFEFSPYFAIISYKIIE